MKEKKVTKGEKMLRMQVKKDKIEKEKISERNGRVMCRRLTKKRGKMLRMEVRKDKPEKLKIT